MKKKLLFLFLILSVSLFSQETLNTMFYNVFKFPNSLPQNRQFILKDILDEYKPDLFMICELVSENGADLILNTSLENQKDKFARALFVPDSTKLDDPLQTMVFYNTRKLTLVKQQKIPTVYRDINQYSFQLNVSSNDPINLEVFVAHLKSSTGPANRQMRLEMVQEVTKSLKKLTQPNTYVLFAGDFNLYNSTEPAYQEILNPENAILMIDPIDAPGKWQDNPAFSYLHTQSTRVSSVGFGSGTNSGAGGGLDDRFDFIMMSKNFKNSSSLSYVNDSYKAYGNNGNCLDKDVKDPNCTGIFSQTLRNNLYYMSDHLPVVMQFKIHDNLSTKTIESKPFFWLESSNITNGKIMIGIDKSRLNALNNTFFVYNSIGQFVKSVPINNQSSITIDFQGLAAGVYYIKTKESNEVLKFIKK
ncbi:T9SS type A sorting domain-containing protein [Empedobacter brevis]|uniref:T9SS type A sorting domain-containing protein n=1 Tax=Empedobacter brevis TaxID=247 RepID=UPI0039AEF3E4